LTGAEPRPTHNAAGQPILYPEVDALATAAGTTPGEAPAQAQRVMEGAGMTPQDVTAALGAGQRELSGVLPRMDSQDLLNRMQLLTDAVLDPNHPEEEKANLQSQLRILWSQFQHQHPAHERVGEALERKKPSLWERLKGGFKKSEIDMAELQVDSMFFLLGIDCMKRNIESFRIAKAHNPDFFNRVLPNQNVSKESTEDIIMMSNRLGLTSDDIRFLIYADGSWNDISKSFDMPIEDIQAVKIAFGG
jgi:hypothetical protein